MMFTEEMRAEDEKRWHARDIVTELGYCEKYMRDRVNMTNLDIRFYAYIMRKAHDMLKAQQPRVMTPADVNNIGPEDVCAFVEIREETHMYACYMRQYDETHTEIMCDVPDLPTKIQNGCARIWTSRPTDEQREKEPWNG